MEHGTRKLKDPMTFDILVTERTNGVFIGAVMDNDFDGMEVEDERLEILEQTQKA